MGARFAGAIAICLAFTGLVAHGAAAQPRAAVGESAPQVEIDDRDRTIVSWAHHAPPAHAPAYEATILDDGGAPGATTAYPGPGSRPIVGPNGDRAIVFSSQGAIAIAMLDSSGGVASFHTVPIAGSGALKATMDAQGRLTVAWESHLIPQRGIELYAFRTDEQGEPGPVRTVFEGSISWGWSMVTDSAGVTTIVRRSGSVDAARLAPDGSVISVQTLGADSIPTSPPVSALDADDNVHVAWSAAPGLGQGADLKLRRITPDGTLGPTFEFGEGVAPPRLVADRQGRLMVFWQGIRSGEPTQALRIGDDGTPGPAHTITPPESGFPDVAFDSQNRATAVWSRAGAVESVRLLADGTPGEPRTLTPNGSQPSIAIDAQDRATVAWTRPYPPRPTQSYGIIQATRLDATGGAGAIYDVSAGDSSPPVLTIDGYRQPLYRVVRIPTSCDEWCDLFATGAIEVLPKGGDSGRAAPASIDLAPTAKSDVCFNRYGDPYHCGTLALRLDKAGRTRAKRALDRGWKLIARFQVLAADNAGNLDFGVGSSRITRQRR